MFHVCALACALTSTTDEGLAAAIYKWVDDKGVTHYSEKPPQGKKPVELPVVRQPTAPAASTQEPQATQKTWQQQEAEFQQRRVEQEEKRMKQEALARGDERSKMCQQARRDFEVIQQQRRVYTVNAQGERMFLDDKDREVTRERLRQFIAQNCDEK